MGFHQNFGSDLDEPVGNHLPIPTKLASQGRKKKQKKAMPVSDDFGFFSVRRSFNIGRDGNQTTTLNNTKKSALLLYSTTEPGNRPATSARRMRIDDFETTSQEKAASMKKRSFSSVHRKMTGAMDLAYSLTSKSNAGLGNHGFVKRFKENTFAQRLQDPDMGRLQQQIAKAKNTQSSERVKAIPTKPEEK